MIFHPVILLVGFIGTLLSPATAQNGGCTQQPVATRLDPPSGTTGQDPFSSSNYTITGQFLNNTTIVVELMSGQILPITDRIDNDTAVSFHIGTVEQVLRTNAVILIGPMEDNCSVINIPITLFPRVRVSYSSSLGVLSAQPGTVIFMTQISCLPGECGDNSTTFTVVSNGIPLQSLDTQNTTLKYAGRLPNFDTSGNRDLSIITEYQTFRLFLFLAYELVPSGTISSVSPSFGQRGTRVTITGNQLRGVGQNTVVSRVLLGGYESEIVDASSDMTIQVRTRSGLPMENGSIMINSTQMFENRLYDGPYTYLENGWTQLRDGVITRIVPLAAQEGREIYVCGTGILGGGDTISSAQFGAANFPILTSIPATPPLNITESECIQVQVGSPSSSTVPSGTIIVTSNTGSYVESTDNFTIASIQGVSPNRGQPGTVVTITGCGLLSGTTSVAPLVFLNDVHADLISFSSTEIVVRARDPPTLLPRIINETTGATEPPPQYFGVMGGVRIEVANPFSTNGIFTVSSATGWQLEENGMISEITPSFGQYGTRITIQGTNLLAYGNELTHVTVDGVNATILDGASNSVVRIIAPNITAIAFVDIMVYSDTGATIRGPLIFEYREAGVVTDVSPGEGQNGTFVTITGANLFGYGENITSVFFGNIPIILDYSTINNTSIHVRVQENNNADVELVTITIISDTSALVQSQGPIWRFLVPGEISSNTPQEGQTGTRIQVTGTNLLGGGSIIMDVFLDGVSAVVVSATDTAISLIAGDLQARQADFYPGQIFIETNTGAIIIGGTYNHRQSGTISAFSPGRGRRGTRVSITGTNLLGFGTRFEQIQLAGVVVESIESFNTTYVIVQAGFSNVSRSGLIVLTTDTGAIITSSSNFMYDEPGRVTSVSPDTGAEGTGVSLSGSSLLPSNVQLTNITVGGILVSRIVTASNTEISVIVGPAPATNPNNTEIVIIASDGSFIDGIFFSFINFVLTLPNLSLGREGTLVNISLPNASQFEPSMNLRVTVGEQPADSVIVYVNQRITTVRIPRARLHGAYTADVAIEGLNGLVARLRDGFTYVSGGLICDIDPSQGQTGTSISLRGENFLGGGRSLMLAEVVGQQAIVQRFTNGTATIQLQQVDSTIFPLSGDIVLTADTGAVLRRLNNFTLVLPGSITIISTSSGQNGTRVSIEGTGLLQGNLNIESVTLAGVPATMVGMPSDILITVQAGPSATPSGSPQPIIITLSTGAIIRSGQTQAMFEYSIAGSITSVTPNSGTVGTRITIQGTNLLQGGLNAVQVLLKGIPATISSFSDTSISIVAQTDTQGQGDIVIVSDTGSTLTGVGLWIYNDLGAILEVSPAISQQGGLINITGFSLLSSGNSIMECRLAGVLGTLMLPVSDTLVQCIAGNISFSTIESTGFVQLITDTGVVLDSSETDISFTYYAASIATVAPSQGNNGTIVTIVGLNLFGALNASSELLSVRFGSIEATILNSSLNEIVVAAGLSNSSSLNDTLRIKSTFGTFLELSNAWNYTDPGRIISVTPQSGFPGAEVELFGENLFKDEGAPYRIIVGQTMAFDVTIIDDNMAMFRTSLYQDSDLPEQELPIQIISSKGETVFDSRVTFRYNETEAAILSVDSSAGSEGSTVVIAGINLPEISDISRITLAGISANIVSANNETIVVIAGQPPTSGTSGPVLIETSEVLLGLTGNAWTYFPVVTSSYVSPNTGQNGTEVTIDLSRIYPLPPVRNVYLSNASAEIIQVNGSILSVKAGPSEEMSVRAMGDIMVLFSDNITITIFGAWTYQEPVVIDQLSPLSGFFNTLVTITGRMFQANNSVTVTDVYLAGLRTTIEMQSNILLQVRPSEELINSVQDIAGPVVIVADDGATFTSPVSLTFTYLGVRVVGVSPPSGTEGTLITLRGENLLAGGSMITSFTVAGIVPDAFPQFNSTTISFKAGRSSTSQNQADISYTMDTGAIVRIPNSWTYLEPGQITFITPTSGQMGTIVSITGTGLFGGGTRAVAVSLNSLMATDIISNFDYFIQVRAPAGTGSLTPGTVRIISDTESFTESPSNIQFSFLEPAQFISISPAEGQNGTIVNITGTGFHNGEGIARVFLAGTEAAIVSVEESSIIVEAGRPSNLESITGPVVVQSMLNTTSVSLDTFTYLQEGVILSVTPDRGRNNTVCLMTGENLFGGGIVLRNVTLDGVAASIINQSSSSLFIRAGLPPSTSASTGNIILISDTNSYVTRIDGWTNVEQGVIDSISPSSGQFGTAVTIRGQNLLSGGSTLSRLLFNDIDLYEISFASDSMITARIGLPDTSYEFTSESVTLLSNFNSELFIQYTWSFLNQSNITDLSPPSGLSNTMVNITGTNLLGGGTQIIRATIAGISATVMSSSDELVVIETGENGLGRELMGTLVLESDTRALTIAEWQYDDECPNNTYGTLNNCMECDIECVGCTGPSNVNCTSCVNFAILRSLPDTTIDMECVNGCPNVSTLDNVCVDACATNQYAQISTGRGFTFCYNCSDLCDPNLGCTGPAPSQCNGCQFFLEVVNQTCVEMCPADRYYINQTKECRPCHEQCSGGCFGPTDEDCLACIDLTVAPIILAANQSRFPMNRCSSSCPELYFEDPSRRRCVPCDSNCEGGCTDSSPFMCHNCMGPFFRYSNGSQKCVNECGPSYYSGLNSQCLRCHDICLSNSTCIGPNPADCSMCLKHQNVCVSDCPVMHFANNFTLVCEECDESCGTSGCVGSSINCIVSQGQFSAGPGTIGIVISIIIILVVIIILLMMFLVWAIRTSGRKFGLGARSSAYDHTDSSTNVNVLRYATRSKVQDISPSPNEIPLKSIETDNHVKNPMFDEMYSEMGPEDQSDQPVTETKAKYVKTKGDEASLPEKNQPISGSQDLYMDMEAPNSPLVKESPMDDEKKVEVTKKSSLPEKNQPISASQDLYMDMDAPTSASSQLLPESSADDEKSAQSTRESMLLEKKKPASGSPYITMAPAQRASLVIMQEDSNNQEKSAGYSKVQKGAPLPEKNQPISGSQDLYTEMDAPKTSIPLIEEVTASQDVYTDMEEMGPTSLPARDTDTAPIIPPKPTLKPPISVPPPVAKTESNKATEKPPIPQKAEKPPPPGPPTEFYADMDGGITEVFMNPMADDVYDDVAPGTSPPPSSSVPVVDESLYEDTDSTDFIEEYRKSKRDMKMPPVPETRSENRQKRASAPALPSGPIPKKRTSVPLPITPLQKSLSSSSVPANSIFPTSPASRPVSVASFPEEESLYDDIPGLSEQPLVASSSRSLPAKVKTTKKQQLKGKLMKK